MTQIYTIDLEILCFGPASNIRKIRKVFTDLLIDEHGKQSPAALEKIFVDDDAPALSSAISACLVGAVTNAAALKKTGGSRVGLRITLCDINERITEMELSELQVAKTCTCLAHWQSKNDGMQHQVIWNAGEKVSFVK